MSMIICKECKDEVIVNARGNWCPRCRCFVDGRGVREIHAPIDIIRAAHLMADRMIKDRYLADINFESAQILRAALNDILEGAKV